jgi:hypothetical protein
MLATLLPGVRHLRTPLVTGALYFLLLWLWVGPENVTPEQGSSEVEGRLIQLGDLLGHGGIVAALSLGAYLVGSIMTISRWPQVRPTREERENYGGFRQAVTLKAMVWAGGLVSPDNIYTSTPVVGGRPDEGTGPLWSWELMEWLDEDVGNRLSDRVSIRAVLDCKELSPTFTSEIRNAVMEEEEDEQDSAGRRVVDLGEPLHSIYLRTTLFGVVVGEMDLLIRRLQIERESLFYDYDRLKSEAALRYSIAPPLVAVIITAGLSWTPWILLALVVVPFLLIHGRRAEEQANCTVTAALTQGVIESPTVATLFKLAAQAETNQSHTHWGSSPEIGGED